MRLALLLTLLAAGCARAEPVRFATFNAALSRESPGELLAAMRTRDDGQAKAVAAVIQAARPDVLVLQEFDHGPGYDPDGEALRLFQANYLAVPQQDDLEPISYEHVYLAPSNTGKPTGVDLNGDGLVAPCPGAEVGTEAYAADCHGWGTFPGQYAFVILSKHPIDRDGTRTFGNVLWKDLPDNSMPTDFYSDEARAVLRLSSKNHVDVPVKVGDETIHVLAAHPTPPVFDGPEDRNGRRNHDEVGLFENMIAAPRFGGGFPNDQGRLAIGPYREVPGGPMIWQRLLFFWHPGSYVVYTPDYEPMPFIVMGDLNADPNDGDTYRPAALSHLSSDPAAWCLTPYVTSLMVQNDPLSSAIDQLLGDERVNADHVPISPGGVAAAERQGGVNAEHAGDPAADTADWDDDRGPGNLRVDYVLPSRDLDVVGGGVLWPTADEPMMGVDLATVERASDHRLVWVDVDVR